MTSDHSQQPQTEPSKAAASPLLEPSRPLMHHFGLSLQGHFLVREVYFQVFWTQNPPLIQAPGTPPMEESRKTLAPISRVKVQTQFRVKEWNQIYRDHPDLNDFREAMTSYLTDLELKAAAKVQRVQERVQKTLETLFDPKSARFFGPLATTADKTALPAAAAIGRVPRDLAALRDRGYPLELVGENTWTLSAFKARIDALWERLSTYLTQYKMEILRTKLPSADYVLKKKTLRRTFSIDIPVGSSVMTLKNEVITNLTPEDLDRLIDLPQEQFLTQLQQDLLEPVESFKRSIDDQVGKLLKKIRKLPHAELLSDNLLADTLKPYFSRQEEPFRKRHARDALVAVEEKAREAKYRDDVFRLEEHRAEYADVARYYPLARQLHRKLVLYVGPTNSGKTWRALNDLAEGESGAYLAPLRLLALEGQEELEKRGKPTSYITGEERELKPDATFVSSTIEMMDFDRMVDRVVIDEVQLLADERRGWAWLAALVGAPASRVIMTGSPDCIALVRWLASYLGEELEIVECQRYNELRIADVPAQLHQLQPATAVVCFSRRDVLLIKSQIEETSKHRVAVVYGNLSPQVRREEARRFRSGEADILVATDAIAMGLNLPIHQVVFFKTEKFDGESTRPLSMSEIRQIGGRAGRYGFAQFGLVSALTPQALNQVRFALRAPQKPLEPTYYVAPGPNHIRIIGKVLGSDSLERILTFFEKAMDFSDPCFARANIDELSFLSSAIDEALPQFTPVERLGIACAPVDLKSETVLSWFLERMVPAFGTSDDAGNPSDLLHDLFHAAGEFAGGAASGSFELRRAEDYLKTLTVYAWLAYRYPMTFPRIDDCQEKREIVNAFIERSLRAGVVRRCSTCGKQLPATHQFRQCEDCFQKSRKTRFDYPGDRRKRRRDR